MTSTAVFAAQHSSAEFRADMDAAREELAALRAKAERPARCTDEAATLAMRVF
jgi:acid phosphatase (class A)